MDSQLPTPKRYNPAGPPGQVGTRVPIYPGEQYAGPDPQPQAITPPHPGPGDQLPGVRREESQWRQVPVYAGTISADGTEVPLLNPIMGCLVLRVGFRVRGTVDVSSSSYWTLWARIYDEVGDEEDYRSVSTDETSLRDTEGYTLVDRSHELRIEANQELVVRFVKTGSPSDLTQVALYCDYYPGV